MADRELLVELTGVSKDYRALRPLRIHRLELRAGQSIALLGVDAAMSEVLVNLITGAQLPDEGEIRVFGRATASITAVDEWVTELDRFGLISDRAVLVEQFTAEQNLALPISLDIEVMPPGAREEVRRLAAEVGLSAETMARPTSALAPTDQLRLRLGRALALRPRVLLAEHPNALLSRQESPSFARDLRRISHDRGLAALVMTADPTFAGAAADTVVELQPATGVLNRRSGLQRWFSSRNKT
jgi:predicted ABC-type transport system involved in lysophospholipase L1 biosynthesis ATPase subunit